MLANNSLNSLARLSPFQFHVFHRMAVARCPPNPKVANLVMSLLMLTNNSLTRLLGRRAEGDADQCLSAAIQWRRQQEPFRSWEVWHSEDQAEVEPQDLSSSGVPTSGRSGRGHEEVVGRVH